MPQSEPFLHDWLPFLTWAVTLFAALIGGGFALAKWLREVRENRALRAQELLWKQKEALIDRIIAFGDTPGAHNALMMLGSPERDIPLWDKEKPEERYERVTWAEVAEAMAAEDMPLSSKLSAIRDSFNDLLSRLTHIELYRSSSLMNNDDVRLFVSTWAYRFESDEPHIRNIRLYIRRHNLRGVEKLLKETGGVDISEKWEDDNRLNQLEQSQAAKAPLST